MLSERTYWVALVVGLIAFVSSVRFLLIPFHIVDYDLGINLISEGFGILFTIVFLTWIIRTRELSRWKKIEKRVRHKIAFHLWGMSELIYSGFLKTPPRMSEGLEKKRTVTLKVESGLEKDRILYSLYIEHYADEKTTMLRDDWNKLCLDGITVNYLSEKRDFFEHMLSAYADFLNPDLMDTLMSIVDDLDRVLRDLNFLSHLRASTKEEYEELEEVVTDWEPRLKNALHGIIKGINRMNKMGLGLYASQ